MRLLEEPIWAYFRLLHNQADLNLCPSHYTRIQLENHDFERVEVWGRGVDTELYNPSQADATWRHRLTGGHPERPLMLYVGRLATEKRIDWMRPILDLVPDVALAIVGDGPLREELGEIYAGTNTVFTGYLKGNDLAHAYASADLFTFPSPSETFGNVVLEAMASGLPVVAAGAGGPVDHVFHGQNGYLSDPEDSSDFAALVWRCFSDAVSLREMGREARSYAETQTWTLIFDELLDRYARLIHDGSDYRPAMTLGERWRARHGRGNSLAEIFKQKE
jgi:glycosyltransferase involved in cell wall biosynthesis